MSKRKTPVVHRLSAKDSRRTWCGREVKLGVAYAMGDTFTCKACKLHEDILLRQHRDPLAGIPPELQAKMRDPAWREAFNAPLTPERAAKVMPPVDVLALMLARWMNISPTTRQWFVGVNRRCSAINEKHDFARAEGATADLLEALDLVIAAANAQPGDGVKDGAR